MTIYRTKNINILETWLIGGQTDSMGNCCEGFYSLTENGRENGLIKNKEIDKDFLIAEIEACIDFCQDPLFYYYGDKYRFSMPSKHNFKILIKRIEKRLKEIYELT